MSALLINDVMTPAILSEYSIHSNICMNYGDIEGKLPKILFQQKISKLKRLFLIHEKIQRKSLSAEILPFGRKTTVP